MSALERREEAGVLTQEGLIRLNGEAVRFDAAGVLHWPAEETVVVADLHLEKGSAAAVRGRFLPPYDSRMTLNRLEEIFRRLAPKRLIALGDSFHDGDGENRLAPVDADKLKSLISATDWIWITGNHDPEPPKAFGGAKADRVTIGGLTFCHEPSRGRAAGEVAGHLHPAAKVGVRGRAVRRRAFVSDGRRAILPAFGAYTGGLNVLDPAFRGMFERAASDRLDDRRNPHFPGARPRPDAGLKAFATSRPAAVH